MLPASLPYERLSQGRLTLIARADVMPAFVEASAHGTLYAWAAAQPDRREFMGRLPAYAVRLPHDGPRVVVRHNRHGGLLASWRGDRFVFPRATRELAVSRLLRRDGVPTPEVLGVAVYRDGWASKRSDVVTVELPTGRDFGAVLREVTDPDERTAAWRAVGHLLQRLAAAGAWHADLNVKNIFVSRVDGSSIAFVLDVDRIRLGEPGLIVAKANRARLIQSLDKWQRRYGVTVTDADRAALAVREAAP